MTKFFGVKLLSGPGYSEKPWTLRMPGQKTGDKIYFERGSVEGQDKIFVLCGSNYHPAMDRYTVEVYTTSRAFASTMTTAGIYTLNKNAANEYKYEINAGIPVVLCKDIKDIVTQIRNDFGKVKSYRNMDHGEEKDGVIYSKLLK